MNKEVIEKAKKYLKQQEIQDAEETKEDLRILYKILKNEHREGTLTIEKGLKYISKLELEVASYKMIHEHDLAMIEEAKGNAVKWSKERDNFKSILDKVTEECRKQMTTYEDIVLGIFSQRILNIIEGGNNGN